MMIRIESPITAKEVLEGQRTHWDKTFSQKPEMFGREPSDPALKAAELFKREGKTSLLELGAGQGQRCEHLLQTQTVGP